MHIFLCIDQNLEDSYWRATVKVVQVFLEGHRCLHSNPNNTLVLVKVIAYFGKIIISTYYLMTSSLTSKCVSFWNLKLIYIYMAVSFNKASHTTEVN